MDETRVLVEAWTVQDGILSCRGLPMGYLRTDSRYQNYVLSLEWRFPKGKARGNSGVLLRVQTPDKVWPQSLEVQLLDGNAGDLWSVGGFGLKPVRRRTEGRRTKKMDDSSEKPLGQWNLCEIRLEGEKLVLKVNGVTQNKVEGCESGPGFIALEAEGSEIQFRKIRLKELP